jgi:Winged helix DNA-binding domain
MASQLLHRPVRQSPPELASHLLGVQAQVISGAGLALRARTRGLTAGEVELARLVDRSIVLTWAMRGTLHLVSPQDYRWLVPLVTQPRVPNAHRRLRQEGVSEDQPARAVRLIEQMLEREGPLTRREIAARLGERGLRTEGQAIAHLVWLAAAEGLICHGPDRGREQCFVLVRDWVGETPPLDREAAMAELAVRYLRAHQPAGPRDLASWSGLSRADATRCWRLAEGRLTSVESSRGTLWELRGDRRPAYAAAPSGLVHLLPSFDEYLLGWQDRELSVAPGLRTMVNRGGGWLQPVLLSDGHVVGTWSTERTSRLLQVRVSPFGQLDAAERRGVKREGEDVSAYLGTPVETVLA